jgi:hypothetical protein
MFKKIILFIAVTAIFCTSATVHAQDDQRKIYEYIMLSPVTSQLKTLQDNMRKHNQKYHSSGPYTAYVFNIATGKDAGKIVWQMGPIQLSDLDARPSDNGHDEDWRDNIMPYVRYQTDAEYWNTDANLSLFKDMSTESVSHPLLAVRFYNVHRGKRNQVDNIFKNRSAALEGLDNAAPWGLFYNMFQQGEQGRHIASVRYFKNWTDYAEPRNFMESYEEVHGNGSWANLMDLMQDAFSDSWDVFFQYDAYMSGK